MKKMHYIQHWIVHSIVLVRQSVCCCLFISGISSQMISISEIGVSFPDESFGAESRFGIPFTVSISVVFYRFNH